MPLEDFEVREALGKGSFGSVSKCVRKTDQEVYAIKQVKHGLFRLKSRSSKKKINRMQSIRLDSLLLYPVPMWWATRRPSMTKNHKIYAS